MSPALVRAYAHRGQTYQDVVWQAVQDLADYLGGNTSGSFYDYDLGQSSEYCSSYPQDDSGETLFVEAVLEEMKPDLIADDNVIISHSCFDFGYGGGRYEITLDDGSTAYGHAVYAGPGAASWEVYGFTWHELCHSYGADHGNATFDLSGSDMHHITPMGMGYVHTDSGNPDTRYSAVDSDPNDPAVPDYFCYGKQNFYYPSYVHSDKEANHDLDRLAYCTESKIENWLS